MTGVILAFPVLRGSTAIPRRQTAYTLGLGRLWILTHFVRRPFAVLSGPTTYAPVLIANRMYWTFLGALAVLRDVDTLSVDTVQSRNAWRVAVVAGMRTVSRPSRYQYHNPRDSENYSDNDNYDPYTFHLLNTK